jgi:nuclear cap-binding protein subunit 1
MNHTDTPYHAEGQQILGMLRKKIPETEIETVIESIQSQAAAQGVVDTLVPSTDAYMTAVCHIGSKSLSHVLSCIDRCKERLLAIGAASEPARRQIIHSVVDYWKDLPGVAVNIVDKLLNFTIVTPESVIRWCLGADSLGDGSALSDAWRFEMLAGTMGKITNRMRQIVAARVQALKAQASEEQIALLDETITRERDIMRALFALIGELLSPYADGTALADSMTDEDDAATIQAWAARWIAAFKRKSAVEETVVGETAVEATLAIAKIEAARDEVRRLKEEEEREKRRLEEEERRRLREEEDRVRKEKEEELERKSREKGALEEAANGGADSLDVADDDDV